MLENFIMQIRRPKGVLNERKAFVSRAARASAAGRKVKIACEKKILIYEI